MLFSHSDPSNQSAVPPRLLQHCCFLAVCCVWLNITVWGNVKQTMSFIVCLPAHFLTNFLKCTYITPPKRLMFVVSEGSVCEATCQCNGEQVWEQRNNLDATPGIKLVCQNVSRKNVLRSGVSVPANLTLLSYPKFMIKTSWLFKSKCQQVHDMTCCDLVLKHCLILQCVVHEALKLEILT